MADLAGRIEWLTINIQNASMGPVLRSRKDVTRELTWVRHDFQTWHNNEVAELRDLNSSQCSGGAACYVQFNTSSLLLTGVIAGRGTLSHTADGTEVALFTFNSIYLGPETEVRLVGQRALVLLSKTSLVVNTTIEARSGYIGGFPGGGSVARLPEDALSDAPRPILVTESLSLPPAPTPSRYLHSPSLYLSSSPSLLLSLSAKICDLGNYCQVPRPEVAEFVGSAIKSNNVNGPGSGNVRVNAFVLRTSAPHVPEVQFIRTSAAAGQTLSGGFSLHFKDYSTTIVPHDASASLLQRVIQQNLNLANKLDRSGTTPGVGNVTVTRSQSDSSEG